MKESELGGTQRKIRKAKGNGKGELASIKLCGC